MKDWLGNRLHELVCSGRLSLDEAQREIAMDWIAVYREYVGAAVWCGHSWHARMSARPNGVMFDVMRFVVLSETLSRQPSRTRLSTDISTSS